MKKLVRLGLFGLAALAGTGSLFATTLTLTGTVMSVGAGGGEYTANLSSPTVTGLEIYCVDFKDDASFGFTYDVTLSTIGGPTFAAATNYGGTPQANFTFQNSGLGDGLNRYLLAGYLVTQFNTTLGGSDPNNIGIQNAIWDILNTSTTTFADAGWITNAINWAANPANSAAMTDLLGEITIYDGICTAGPECDGQTMQEFISLSGGGGGQSVVPEPGTFVMLGCGLGMLGFGAFRRRRR